MLRRRLVLPAALFVVVFGLASWSLSMHSQIGALGGLLDEWYALGLNLCAHGTLGVGDAPSVFRAPGYPAVEAAAIRSLVGPWPESDASAYVERAPHAIYLVQAFLLALSSVAAFLWLKRLVRVSIAFVAAFLLGVDPYALVFVGALRYDILFMTGLLASGWALEVALRDQPPRPLPLLFAGLWCGLTTLVRPLLLALPPFLLLAAWFRMRDLKAATRATIWAGLGMLLALAPYTARNYAVSGRLVLVSAQTWAAVWGSTVKVLPVEPDSYRWYGLSRELVAVYARTTGKERYDYLTWMRHNLELESALRSEALANMRTQPMVYVTNCVASLASYAIHSNTSVLAAFQQTQHAPLQQSQFAAGSPIALRPSIESRAYGLLMACLTLLAAAGLARAVYRRDAACALPAAFALCLWLGHGLTYLDMLYYFSKLPFLIVFSALFVDRLQTTAAKSRWQRRASAAALAIYLALLAATLALDLRLFVL